MTSSGKKYKFIQNKHLIISSFFDNLEATLESVDDVNNVYELKLNYHVHFIGVVQNKCLKITGKKYDII